MPGGISQALCQVSRFEHPEFAFGFSFQVPLLNRSAQADHVRARIEKNQAETSLLQMRSRIRLEVRNAFVALTQSKAQAESALKAVELRQKSLREEEEKLLAGTSTPYEVIRRQRDLMTAQYEEVRARTSYAKAKVDLDRATGRTGE
jgi:outer membrane protein TolC